ncbi:Tricalbin-1 [Candida viswanathii]|uniref:Tricalbin-1 n=1 Tax=Candida viswanathii TaxID=5486 RepID=A0A367YGT8_9ASCO|nr:Tricalbin-1 [Candida viswanathii]
MSANGAAVAVNPSDTLEQPKQVEIKNQAAGPDGAPQPGVPADVQEEVERPKTPTSKAPTTLSSLHSRNSSTTSLITPSEDFDMSNVKTKPPPRQPVDPTYMGWKEVGGFSADDALSAADETVDLLTRGSLFDQYLPAVMYGDWYHNAGYLIVAAFLSWLIGWFKFSVAPLFFVMAVFSVLYRASVKKYRGVLREQAQREFSVKEIETDYETMDWCNYFLEQFWYFLEPSVSQIACDQVNPILASSPAPAFVKSLWLDSFTLGTKPPRIDAVKTLTGTAADVVVMDWAFSFTPNALVDANYKQLKNRVNERIVVKANVFGVVIPIAVEDVSFQGIARIRMRLMTSFPHVETINVSMLHPPVFDFNAKVLSESSWWSEVLALPGLYSFINEMVKKYVGPLLFSPISFQLNVQQLLAGNALDSAIGVLTITVDSARGLKGFKTIGNTLDPYLTFGFQNKVLGKTKVIDDTSSPVWKETVSIPISSLSEPFTISCIDFNDFRKDRQVGAIQFDLESLIDEPKQSNLTAAFMRNNKPVGELSFGLHFMPTIEPITQADGAVTPPPDLNTGIARVQVIEARNLRGGEKGASTYAEIIFNGEPVLTTHVQKNTNNPGWGATTEQIVYNRAKCKVKIQIKDKSGKLQEQLTHSLNELIDATQVEQTWFPLSRGGELRVSTTWKPVELEGASGAGGYTPPIGAVRVGVLHAEDLRNLETIGKVDPYVRLLVNGFERARTNYIDSTLMPTWNEVHYVTVSSPNQKLTIEVMDVEKNSPDRTLGSFDVKLSDLIQKDESGNYIEHVDLKLRTGRLIHKKGPKGTVTYTLSFYPTLPVMSLQDYKEEEEEKKKIEEEKQKLAEEQKESGKTEDGQEQKMQEEIDEDDEIEDDAFGNKLRLSLDQLLEYQSGVLVYSLENANMRKEGYFLQVYTGNQGYPDFATDKVGVTGDSVITELEYAQTEFRVVKKASDNRLSKSIAEATIPALQLVKNGYNKPMNLELSGANATTVSIQFSWIPLVYKSGVPKQDSINNSGILTVNVIRAEGLPSADRNGKSDPFIQVFLNTDKEPFTKTKTIKKTLDPVWNHEDTTEVANLVDSSLKLVCYDWDMANKNDLLGTAWVQLGEYDFDESPEIPVSLEGEEGEPAGIAYISMSFKPEFILNLTAGGSSSTNVGKVGAKGVGAVGKGVGKGVGTVGKGIGKGLEKGIGGGFKGIRKGLHFGKSE